MLRFYLFLVLQENLPTSTIQHLEGTGNSTAVTSGASALALTQPHPSLCYL